MSDSADTGIVVGVEGSSPLVARHAGLAFGEIVTLAILRRWELSATHVFLDSYSVSDASWRLATSGPSTVYDLKGREGVRKLDFIACITESLLAEVAEEFPRLRSVTLARPEVAEPETWEIYGAAKRAVYQARVRLVELPEMEIRRVYSNAEGLVHGVETRLGEPFTSYGELAESLSLAYVSARFSASLCSYGAIPRSLLHAACWEEYRV